MISSINGFGSKIKPEEKIIFEKLYDERQSSSLIKNLVTHQPPTGHLPRPIFKNLLLLAILLHCQKYIE
jgi:hypothetical protein